MRPIALVWTCLAGLCIAAGAPAAEVELPVSKVTAFSSGVAYFEHAGSVSGDADVLLKFKVEQINDILKSLVVMDLGGGDVTGVSYASRDPVSRALKSFGIDISGEPTLAELLKQIRGAEVTVMAQARSTGKVLGVEAKTKHILPSNTLITQEVLNLLTAQGIRSIPLDSISSLVLADEKLNAELNKALALLVESRDSNRKPVNISFAGRGKREVRVGYIAEAPVWKTSYRLVLGADDIRIQGWAIVENTSDSDWEKVDLTLVSGRPISFIQDLYTPLYMPRPVVQPELYASLRPQRYDEGLAVEEKAKQLALKKAGRAYDARRAAAPAAAAKPGYALAEGRARGRAEATRALQRGVQSVAAAAEVGELFSYHIQKAVTLQRRKSAMLPIVNQAVEARKVSIYNASTLAKHPLNGLWLTNNTELSLLAGPVTVFDGGTYAGDAQIDNLSPKDKRLLSYAIDLKVTVDASSKSASKITLVRIVRGVLETHRRHEYTQTYLVKNKAEEKRTLVIEHPYRSNLKLISPAKPTEKTPTHYRFEVDVPPSKPEPGKFAVVEERTDRQTVAILPADVRSLHWYSTNAEIPKKVRDAIAETIRRKQALTEAERKAQDIERQITRLRGEQGHIRQNMNAMRDPNSPGYKTFASKLLELEKQIEQLQDDLKAAKAKADELRKALEDHLSKLNVS